MSELVTPNPAGNCVYCNATNYDAAKTEARNPIQDRMFCIDCARWSVRMLRNGTQYPIQDPADKESSPTTTLRM